MPEIEETLPVMSLIEFLESAPPGRFVQVDNLTVTRPYSRGVCVHLFSAPEIQLYCESDTCNRKLFFRAIDDSLPNFLNNKWHHFYVTYCCSNCQKTEKTFSLAAKKDNETSQGECYKFGEKPAYGPHTPTRLNKLIGPDRDLFLKGRRCESQGLGIGAFSYYRRVVENQKNRILDEIIKVAQKVGTSPEAIGELKSARLETQFSKALANIKTSIPQSLMLNDDNPLSLLHSVLSQGLHGRTDEECLELARSIRIVLAELSERISQALKDEEELNRALSRLKKN